MSAIIYDEIEIEDFDFDSEMKTYFYPCPCGDRFQITEVNYFISLAFVNFLFLGRIGRWRRNRKMSELLIDDSGYLRHGCT